jgi:D-alanyl-D-alanine carboxypeptidase
MWAGIACAATGLAPTRAAAEALLVIEAESGKVLYAQNAGYPWYPASVTKLMTAYVTLRAVDEGRITLDKPLTVSANAAAQNPVKMGFPAGTQVTVDNALKMLMVKSANDMAVVLAEGVAGSVENFADQMNATAQRLGMVQSSFVNPNGLPADDQISSARDLAILARALIREMPEYDYYWNLPGIRMGKMVQRNYNTLLGRYPGADGMKTGFICASGFNLVASATRDGKRLIAVVLGAPSSAARAMKAAQLLERGFNSSSGLSWLMPAAGTVESVRPIDVTPPNLRDQMCGPHRKRPAAENEDDFIAGNSGPDSPYAVFLSSLRGSPTTAKAGAALLQDVKLGEPVLVFTGTKPPTPGAQAAIEKKKTVAAKPSSPKDASDTPAAAASSGETAASKSKPKPPAPRDTAKVGAPTTAAVAATGGAAAPKPKPKPAAPASTVAATPTGDAAAAKPKPKPPAPRDTAKDGAASTATAPASGDAAPKPKPKPPAPKAAPISLTPAAQPTQQSSQAR